MELEKQIVLVVEADPPVRELLSDVLMDEGYDVITAYDGEDARSIVASCHVDVVAIDLDTLDTTVGLLLREARVRSTDPCIMALNSSQPPHRGAGWAHAAIAKPFDVEQLVDAVRELLASRRGRGSAAREAQHGRRSRRGRAYGVPERPAVAAFVAGS